MSPGLRDLKHCGTERAPMPAPMRAVCAALIAVAVLGTAYGLVKDEPARQIVAPTERTITPTESEFVDVLEAARLNGMKAGIAQKQCRPGDEFLCPPRKP